MLVASGQRAHYSAQSDIEISLAVYLANPGLRLMESAGAKRALFQPDQGEPITLHLISGETVIAAVARRWVIPALTQLLTPSIVGDHMRILAVVCFYLFSVSCRIHKFFSFCISILKKKI